MYQKLLEEVTADHLSGASELAHKAARVLASFCQEYKGGQPEQFSKEFINVAKELVRAQREITPIFNLTNLVVNTLKSQPSKLSVPQLAEILGHQVQQFERSSLQALESIWKQGAELLPAKATVMVFSSSASVLGILREAHRRQKSLRAYVCESRPLLEGRRLARMLAEEGIRINLIVDAAAGYFIPKTDLVLVGADSISEDDFVNKIGTFALGVLARRHKKPFWVAAEETKFISREARGYPAISGEPAEVWQQSQPHITCLNPYFEVIPLDLVGQILTNQGILTPSEVPNFVRQFPLAPELVEL